ncbi:MAG: nitrogen regulation protein NR(I) [Gammaproteobacteria bacterium]|nr:nitrogen regulation protein NR(I) [Gammaproteobacteria bacterium]
MTANRNIWVADDDRSIRWVLEKALAKEGYEVSSFETGEKLLNRLDHETPDLIISDIRMPGMDGIRLLDEIKQRSTGVPVIVMTAYSDIERAVSAFQGGAFEFLSKPFDVDEMVGLVRRALRPQQSERLPEKPGELPGNTGIVGSAQAMQEVFRAIGRLSRSHLTVLITGESGTGKELVARALHRHSPRSEQPFIALNTAAIPRELLESELFGHERGAFTGASAQRLGRFEQANHGCLFLDEIGDMPAELQTRLLRVLADGEFYRVGGHTPVRVDVRVIAATHQNLEQRVRDGVFREDLFHRLNVIRVHVPPLRERRSDIPVLTEHFLRIAATDLGVEAKRILPETQAFLNGLDWPGNVRQLENFCRWVTVMASGGEVHTDDLPPELKDPAEVRQADGDWESGLRKWVESNLIRGETRLLHDAVPRFERIMIEEALKRSGGRRQDAARLLGWGRNTLTRKIRGLGLEV